MEEVEDEQPGLSFGKKVGLFLGRFRRLPATFWIVLATIFGIADFLTWSVLSDVAPNVRFRWTLAFLGLSLVVTIITVLRSPTEDERITRARILSKKARRAYNANEYNEALQLLKPASQLDKESVGIVGLLGRTLVRLGYYAEAIQPLTQALEGTKITSNKIILLTNRGVSLLMLAQYGRAHDDFSECIRYSPNSSRALRFRALTWLYLGRPDNGLQDINAALKTRPKYLCGHATKAIILHELGQIEPAEKELEKCEKLLPEDADDFYCMAIAYGGLNKAEQAIKALKVAIEHDPKYRARATLEPLFTKLKDIPAFRELSTDVR